MPRVIGIDPGTISIDICGLDNGRVFVDDSFPTSTALTDPPNFLARLESYGPVDLIAGPSGYGLPFISGRDVTDTDLRLAFLAAEGESGGIGGLRTLARALAGSRLPVVFTPGVIHLETVPAHRKVNRVDMGTADKVCAAILAVREQTSRRQCAVNDASFIMLELGGAFTAAIAVQGGQIVDGVGGSSGPIGARGAGALDGEVAFLAGHISKSMIFSGGAVSVAGDSDSDTFARAESVPARLAWDAYIEGAVKAVVALCVSAPNAIEVIVSGRMAAVPGVLEAITQRLAAVRGRSVPASAKASARPRRSASRAGGRLQADLRIEPLKGFAAIAKQGAQGAALLADGLVGGSEAALVESVGVRATAGTVLDHLHVVSPELAKARLGIS